MQILNICLLALAYGICLTVIVSALVDPPKMLQLPFVSACAVAVTLLPQFLKLLMYSGTGLYPPDITRALLMTCLCLLAMLFGYYSKRRPPSCFLWKYSPRRMLLAAIGLIVIGSLAGLRLASLPAAETTGVFEGRAVAWLFFAKAHVYGFAIVLIMYLRTRKLWLLLLLVPNVYSQITLFVCAGRRTEAASFCLIILCSLYFVRRWLLPFPVFFAGVFCFALFVNSVNEYRHVVRHSDDWWEVRDIDFLGNASLDGLETRRANEAMNAIVLMAVVAHSGQYDLGTEIYNYAVRACVPRQIVGRQFKEWLMIGDQGLTNQSEIYHKYRGSVYYIARGSCKTGIAESFLAFAYLGCLLFYIVGRFVRTFWEGAVRGHLAYQVLYASYLAVFSVVFSGTITNFFVYPWLHVSVFLLPAFLFARIPSRVANGTRTNNVLRDGQTCAPGQEVRATIPQGINDVSVQSEPST